MKTFLIALPNLWEKRLVEVLAGRGISPVIRKRFDGEEEILKNGDPTVIFLPGDVSPKTALQFCRRLRERRPLAKLQVMCCASRRPSKENWLPYAQAGVNFVLPASISDFELGVRLSIAECLLTTDSPHGDATPPADQELDFNLNLEDTPYGMLLSSLSNKLLKVNDGLVQLLGYSSKEELLRIDIDRDLYADPQERAWLLATLPLQNKAVEVVWKRRDGTPITILFSANVVIDEVRRTIYLQGVIWDITEQKRSLELLRMQRDLMIELSRIDSLETMIDSVFDRVMRIEGVDTVGFFVVEPETRIYRMAASRGISPEGIEVASVGTPDMQQVQLCEKGYPIYQRKEEFDSQIGPWCLSEGILFLACLPIVHNGRVIAAMNIASRTRDELSPSSKIVLETIAARIGGALARVQAEELLRESEMRYRLIADNVDEVVWSARWSPPDFTGLDARSALENAMQSWRFLYVSPSVERMLGYSVEECLAEFPNYRRLFDSFPAVVEAELKNFVAQSALPPHRHRFEVPVLSKSGHERWFEMSVAFLPTQPGEPLQFTGIARDITLRHEAEGALRESESRLRGLLENMPDVVVLFDREGRIRYVNHRTPKVPTETLLGGHGLDFVHESCKQKCQEAFNKALSTNETQIVEAIVFTGNCWSYRLVPLLLEGKPSQVMAICTDITVQKTAAEAVHREQQLLRQLIDLQERERKFLSYEIHDGFAQQITGALFHLESFKQLREFSSAEAEKNLNQAAALLSRSIDETRRLISGLRPPILDESGILAAVEYLVAEFRERSGIDIMLQPNMQAKRLAAPLESAIFRIIQESLINAVRHSGSDFVRVELNESEGRLEIVVFDEGRGFDAAVVPEDRFGLRSIRERARLFGGEVEIETSPGEGCRIRAVLPIVLAMGE